MAGENEAGDSKRAGERDIRPPEHPVGAGTSRTAGSAASIFCRSGTPREERRRQKVRFL